MSLQVRETEHGCYREFRDVSHICLTLRLAPSEIFNSIVEFQYSFYPAYGRCLCYVVTSILYARVVLDQYYWRDMHRCS